MQAGDSMTDRRKYEPPMFNKTTGLVYKNIQDRKQKEGKIKILNDTEALNVDVPNAKD